MHLAGSSSHVDAAGIVSYFSPILWPLQSSCYYGIQQGLLSLLSSYWHSRHFQSRSTPLILQWPLPETLLTGASTIDRVSDKLFEKSTSRLRQCYAYTTRSRVNMPLPRHHPFHLSLYQVFVQTYVRYHSDPCADQLISKASGRTARIPRQQTKNPK